MTILGQLKRFHALEINARVIIEEKDPNVQILHTLTVIQIAKFRQMQQTKKKKVLPDYQEQQEKIVDGSDSASVWESNNKSFCF